MILLREILGERDIAFKGISVSGDPFITVVSNFRVFLGKKILGAPLYTIIDNKLFKGMSISGRPLATLVGDLIFPDVQISGSPIARIRGRLSYTGISVSGIPIITVPSSNKNTLFAATYHALRG